MLSVAVNFSNKQMDSHQSPNKDDESNYKDNELNSTSYLTDNIDSYKSSLDTSSTSRESPVPTKKPRINDLDKDKDINYGDLTKNYIQQNSISFVESEEDVQNFITLYEQVTRL